MEQLNNLDVVFLIIVGISALVGIARGMTKEILSILGWVLAAVAIFYLVPIINPIMEQYIASKMLASVVSGLAVLIVFCIIWILTADKLGSVVRASRLSAVDRILGFVFGAARGVLIVILVALMITTIVPEEAKKGVFKDSQYFQMASNSVEPVKNMIPQSWIDGIKAKTSELVLLGGEKDKATAKDEKKPSEKEVAKAKDSKDTAAKEPTLSEKLRQAAEAVDNLQALKKDGEELFNQLAQPKTAGADETADEEDLSSDLDMLLDVLEDRVVTTDEETPELKSESQEIMENVKGKVKGK